MITLDLDDYISAVENYQGICLECEELKDGVEPDAEEYECDYCGAKKVVGMEMGLMLCEIAINECPKD
jgi:hypothetical protein